MRNDLEKLQGTWHIVALELDGERMPDDAVSEARLVIDGTRFESLGMGAPYTGTFQLDSTTTPRTIDLVITGGHAAGTRNLGIYRLEGDAWTICLATRGNRRPRTFATKPGTGLALETFERSAAPRASAKAKSRRQSKRSVSVRAASPTIGSAGTTSSAPATAIEGEWAMVEGVFSGVAMADSMVEWCKRVTRGDVTTVLAGPKVMLRARFTLDASTRPQRVDYVNVEGSNAGSRQAGIVDLSAEVLRICMAAPGKPRPTAFTSNAGDGRSYTTWRLISR